MTRRTCGTTEIKSQIDSPSLFRRSTHSTHRAFAGDEDRVRGADLDGLPEVILCLSQLVLLQIDRAQTVPRRGANQITRVSKDARQP